MKVIDIYPDDDDFEELLASAEENASSEWETEFVSSLQERYEQYGINMFLSDKQDEILKRIAEGESGTFRT